MRYPPLRYHLERVLRDMGGGISHFAEIQGTTLFGDHPFSIKHPQDNFGLQNVNWHPPKCKLTPSKEGLATSNLQFFYRNTQKSPLPNFTFWRVSICILEAEIVLGVLYRKGWTPKKVGTLGFPQHWAAKSAHNFWHWEARNGPRIFFISLHGGV